MYVAININQLKSPYHYFRSAFLILIMGSQHGGFIYIFRLQKFSDMPDPVFFLDHQAKNKCKNYQKNMNIKWDR